VLWPMRTTPLAFDQLTDEARTTPHTHFSMPPADNAVSHTFP
jgi:hypothetical protein